MRQRDFDRTYDLIKTESGTVHRWNLLSFTPRRAMCGLAIKEDRARHVQHKRITCTRCRKVMGLD